MASGTVAYLIFAGIVLVIALIVMMAWTIIHMKKSESSSAVSKPQDKRSKPFVSPDVATDGAAKQEAEDPPKEVHDTPAGDLIENSTEQGEYVEFPLDAPLDAPAALEPAEEFEAPLASADAPQSLDEILTQALQDDAVLGWLTVYADGRRGIHAQAYDETVIDLFATLALQAKYTAGMVGLEHAREFVVRGEEGTIVLFPVARIAPDHEDFVVLFVEGDVVAASHIVERLFERTKRK